MADKPSDLVQGTLDMLKTLALEPMHGYGIAVRLEQMSQGVFRPNAGSLFMAIQRLQRDGLIKGEWKSTENNRRAKYRSEEHTSELQSPCNLVCRLLLEKKKRAHPCPPHRRHVLFASYSGSTRHSRPSLRV